MGIREELFGMAVVASGVCSSKLMLGGCSRLMRLPAVHGIIAPRRVLLFISIECVGMIISIGFENRREFCV